ncbi:MAG: M50 family metallopeptidase [Patescibacteria group bacterium]
MILTIVVFLAILGLLVFVHELGHFLAAKRLGIGVEEFAFGFRPRLLAKKIGQTTYALNLIPLGGYVKLVGETIDGRSEVEGDGLASRPISQRIMVLVAGSAGNLVLAWLVLTVLFAVGFRAVIPGIADNPFVNRSRLGATIVEVAADSPASLAGLTAAETISALDGKPVATDWEFLEAIGKKRGTEVRLTVNRDQVGREVTIITRLTPPAGQGPLGIAIGLGSKQAAKHWWLAPLAGGYQTLNLITLSLKGLGQFGRDLIVKRELSDQVTGIIGVGAQTAVARRLGPEFLAQLVAIISVGLALVNLLPIFPLDGGHIAVAGLEKAIGRPLKGRELSLIGSVGLMLVLALFLVVTYRDFGRFNVIDRLF